jgi:hypothetical protein
MLACAQDLYFKTESNNSIDQFNECHKDKRPRQQQQSQSQKMNGLHPQQQLDHVSNKEKEEVT